MSRLQHRFVPLKEAKGKVGSLVDIVGVVSDFLTPTPSRGTDMVCTFTINDASWDEGGFGLRIRYFRPDVSHLPPIASVGDVVVLSMLKIYDQYGEIIGLSNRNTEWAVFHKADIDRYIASPKSALDYEQSTMCNKFQQDDLLHVVKLYRQLELHEYGADLPDMEKGRPPIEAAGSTRQPLKENESGVNMRHQSNHIRQAADQTPAKVMSSGTAKSRKFCAIESLNLPDTGRLVFADLCCEVRKKYDEYEKVNLSVTDYTVNKQLFNYTSGHEEEGEEDFDREGDPYGYANRKVSKWPGPWGRMTLNITCYDGNAQYVKTNVNVGDYVYVSNVHITMGRNGVLLEGRLRDDPKYPSKVLVRKMLPSNKESELQDLLRRKLDYAKRYKQLYDKLKEDSASSNKRPIPGEETAKQESAKKSKTGRERKKTREKEAKKQAEPVLKPSKFTLNPNIRTNQVDGLTHIPLATILNSSCLSYTTAMGTHLTLPFQNVCYKTKLRIVDFFPPSIVNFAAPYRESEYDALSDVSAGDSDPEESDLDTDLPIDSFSQIQGHIHWEWRFCLLVEDPYDSQQEKEKPKMLLHVGPQEADYLLNEEACDLKRNPSTLAKVREKLFHLWGDLEEHKDAMSPSSKSEKKTAAAGNQGSAGDDGAAVVGHQVTPAAAVGGMPFECFIKEYGILKRSQRSPVAAKSSPSAAAAAAAPAPPLQPEYERMFQLFGTSINA